MAFDIPLFLTVGRLVVNHRSDDAFTERDQTRPGADVIDCDAVLRVAYGEFSTIFSFFLGGSHFLRSRKRGGEP
jgi:hypothetical protein